jgi:hypothetical protein
MKDMRIDHRRLDNAMPQQLLDGSNVRATFKEVRGTRMAERVATNSPSNTGFTRGLLALVVCDDRTVIAQGGRCLSILLDMFTSHARRPSQHGTRSKNPLPQLGYVLLLW